MLTLSRGLPRFCVVLAIRRNGSSQHKDPSTIQLSASLRVWTRLPRPSRTVPWSSLIGNKPQTILCEYSASNSSSSHARTSVIFISMSGEIHVRRKFFGDKERIQDILGDILNFARTHHDDRIFGAAAPLHRCRHCCAAAIEVKTNPHHELSRGYSSKT